MPEEFNTVTEGETITIITRVESIFRTREVSHTTRLVHGTAPERPDTTRTIHGPETSNTTRTIHEIVTERPNTTRTIHEIVTERPNTTRTVHEIVPERPTATRTGTSVTTLEPDFTSYEMALSSTALIAMKPTQRTLTTELNETPSQTGASGTSNNGSTATQLKAIAGGITGAAVTIILGLIVFCILRSKRRHRAVHSTSDVDVSTPDVRGQHMSQSAQPSTTPRPFLAFPFLRNRSSSKRTITGSTRNSPAHNNQGNIEPAVNPFKDPLLNEGNLLNNDDEVQRARNALDRLQALTSRFEEEIQQLRILAQSGQLSAEDRLKLEEIRRTTGLPIPFDSRHGQHSITRSTSSGSSSSSAPPSYHTDGN